LKDLNVNISGRSVVIVEDIVDSGLTIDYIRRILLARQPADLVIMTLLNKKTRREVDVPIEYVGLISMMFLLSGTGWTWPSDIEDWTIWPR